MCCRGTMHRDHSNAKTKSKKVQGRIAYTLIVYNEENRSQKTEFRSLNKKKNVIARRSRGNLVGIASVVLFPRNDKTRNTSYITIYDLVFLFS